MPAPDTTSAPSQPGGARGAKPRPRHIRRRQCRRRPVHLGHHHRTHAPGLHIRPSRRRRPRPKPEQAGLAADIATYLPTRDAWIDLRQYATTQTLTIDSIQVPNSWAEAVEQAHPGQLPPGAVAYTIHGTRQRDGVWNGNPTTLPNGKWRPPVFICPPDETCHLLRLSGSTTPWTDRKAPSC